MDQMSNTSNNLNKMYAQISEQMGGQNKKYIMVVECLKILNILGFQDETDREN